MNDPTGARLERRRSTRIVLKGTAIVHVVGRAPYRGRIANLGEGGVSVIGAGITELLGAMMSSSGSMAAARSGCARREDHSHRRGRRRDRVHPPAPAALSRMIDEASTASRASDR